MKANDFINLGFLALGAYVFYKLFGPKGPGAKVVDFIGWVAADFYTWAVLERQNMNLLGNIILPDGSLVPLQNVDIRQAPGGPVVASYGGHFYQLSPADANGNWPAALIQ
jgi:hypothetical protein